jgi:hypothetical protein
MLLMAVWSSAGENAERVCAELQAEMARVLKACYWLLRLGSLDHYPLRIVSFPAFGIHVSTALKPLIGQVQIIETSRAKKL